MTDNKKMRIKPNQKLELDIMKFTLIILITFFLSCQSDNSKENSESNTDLTAVDTLGAVLADSSETPLQTPEEIENFKPYKEIQDKINYLLNTSFILHEDGFIEIMSYKYGKTVHARINIRDICESYSDGSIFFSCCDSTNCINYKDYRDTNYPEKRQYLSWTCGKSVYERVSSHLDNYRKISKKL